MRRLFIRDDNLFWKIAIVNFCDKSFTSMFNKTLANTDQKNEFFVLKFAEKCSVILHWFSAGVRVKTPIVISVFHAALLHVI